MAEGTEVFDTTIAAVDHATKPIAKVLAGIKGLGAATNVMAAHAKGFGAVMKAAFGEAEHGAEHAGHAAEKAGGEMKKAGHDAEKAGQQIEHAGRGRSWLALAAHVSILRGHFGALNASVGELGRSVSEFLPALGAIGAAGGLVGLFELAEHSADAFSEMSKSAVMAGVSVAQFSQLSYAAKLSDVSAENLTTSLGRLNRNMALAASGKNKDLAALFKHLHIALRDSTGAGVKAADMLPQLAEAFRRTTDEQMKARMAMALFGREGLELLPLLTKGSAELDELSKRAQELDFVPTGEAAEGLEQYHRSMLSLSTAVHGFTMELGSKLAPVLRPVIDMATEWVAANREWITTGITDAVRDLSSWLQTIDFKQLIIDTKAWGKDILTLGGHVSGTTTALGAMALALGSPLLLGIAAAGSAMMTLGRIVRGVTLLMMANPWTIAAAAIAGAAIAIYENWDKIGPYFWKIWDSILGAFKWGWDQIKPIVQSLKDAVSWTENSWMGRQLGLADTRPGAPADTSQPPVGAPAASSGNGVLTAPMPHAPGGAATVRVIFENAPPGMRTQTTTTGDVQHGGTEVGYSTAGFAGAY